VARAEIEKAVEPILRRCLQNFGDFTRSDVTDEEFAIATKDSLRPDIRRVSLIVSLSQPFLGPEMSGEGLEVGCGYGFVLLPMAKFFPHIQWTALEHPDRRYFGRDEFLRTLNASNCRLLGLNITWEPFPFPDNHFSVVTFSETLEHLPVERVNFVLSEISRVTRPGGILIVSSPNQAALENRLLLLKGRSILDLPDEQSFAKGVFGHIRLYTLSEIKTHLEKFNFTVERCALESNNSEYRGSSAKSLYRRIYRMYERIEGSVGILRSLADTWYVVARKRIL
jgi:SAM-dependent methyltransferase